MFGELISRRCGVVELNGLGSGSRRPTEQVERRQLCPTLPYSELSVALT